MKARKLFWEKYLEEDPLKYIFTDEVVFKGGKMRSRKWTPESKNLLYLGWNLNAKLMHGVVLV